MDPRPAARVVVTIAVVLLVGCGPDAPTTTSPTTTPPVPSAAPPPRPDVVAPPAPDRVREAGTPLGLTGQGALLPVEGAQVQVEDGADGSDRLTVTAPAGTLAWVAPPPGGRAEHHADGSVTLLDEAGVVVVALAAPVGDGGSWRPQGDVLALEAATGAASFVVGSAAVASATWGQADGGTSLLVVPADWVRGGSLAAQHALASQLGDAEPEAATPSMQAQLWCHVLGAPDKDSWNLEPWRPDVSTSTMLLTRCNPTDADA